MRARRDSATNDWAASTHLSTNMKRKIIAVISSLLFSLAVQGAGERIVKLGQTEVIGSISREKHTYQLHLERPIKIEGAAEQFTDVQLVDTKFKKLAEFDTMTKAQIGSGRYALLGILKKDGKDLRYEVIKCKPLDL